MSVKYVKYIKKNNFAQYLFHFNSLWMILIFNRFLFVYSFFSFTNYSFKFFLENITIYFEILVSIFARMEYSEQK